MKLCFGVDPDLHCTAFAVLKQEGSGRAEIVGLGTAKVPRKATGTEALLRMVDQLPIAIAMLCQQVPSGLWGVEFTAVVEGQRLSSAPGKRHARPEDIVRLGQVAGAALASMRAAVGGARLLCPQPQEWKGQVPKLVHQGRTLNKLGLRGQVRGTGAGAYCVPEDAPQNSDWKHLCDALGLALWGLEQ